MTYTSGTTGRPKGIARPAPAPARETPPNPFASFWGFGPDDVHLMCGPMYHTAPSAYALMSLGEGGTVVIMAKWDSTECLRSHRGRAGHHRADGPGQLHPHPRGRLEVL